MGKAEGTVGKEPQDQRWSTWEELLLACAVKRHGTKRWTSVAAELQKRSSISPVLLSPQNCHRKYLDLKRRFSPVERNDTVKESNDIEEGEDSERMPLLEELRKLRVAELKREVERSDLSIVSLQLKVERMMEERERSTRDSGNGGEANSDLEKSETKVAREEEKPSPGRVPVKHEPSVSESNSTGSIEPEPDRTGEENPRAVKTREMKLERDQIEDQKRICEDSCNGSSDSVENEPVGPSVKSEPVSDSPELLESVAESKGGEEGRKEGSDVQSSASKSSKDENDKILCGRSVCDGRGNENRSAAKELPVESRPLVDFLQRVRRRKYGSVFERRLESQDTPSYSKLVRQHVDLEMVQTRVKEGLYLVCNKKFFRDLLLLVNNALLFFGKHSSEFSAALELRQLISEEMTRKNFKSGSSYGKTSPQLPSLTKTENPHPADSLLLKPKIAGSLIVCRKRSSIIAKSSASSSGTERKKEQTPLLSEGRAGLDHKQHPNQTLTCKGEHKVTKKRSRDRFTSDSTSLKKNDKTSEISGGKGGDSSLCHPEPKNETKSTVDVKKRSAANFLNRMKQSSSSNKGLLVDALKGSSPHTEPSSKEGSEQKRNESGKGNGKKTLVSAKSLEAKQAKEKGSSGKNVGRPTKKCATPSPPLGKRTREGCEIEAMASKQPRKRSRK